MDNETHVVIGADSQTADEHLNAFELPDIDSFSDVERNEWLLKGTPVRASEKEADPPPADKSVTSPGSEPGSTQEKKESKPKGADARKDELNAEIRELIAKRDGLKAEVTGKTDKPAEKAAPVKPVRPKETDKAYDGEDGFAKFSADLLKYEDDKDAWLIAETRRAVESEFTSRTAQTAAQKVHSDATAEHGADWPKHRDAVIAATSEDFQVALSGLSSWPALVAHLGKPENAAVLKDLAARFAHEPFEVIGELRVLRDKVNTAPAKQEKTTKAPRPPADIAGHQSAPDDPLRAAVESGNQEEYNRLRNARDLRRLKTA